MATTSQLTYNRVLLDIIRTIAVDRRPVLDAGNVYLWTEWTFHIVAWFNPGLTAFTRQLFGGAPVDARGRNVMGPATEVAIRDALSQPRRQLTYTVGGTVILESPSTSPQGSGVGVAAACDANTGPVVLEAPRIVAVHGSRTFQVEFIVRTWVADANLYRADQRGPVVLSNTFSRIEDVDEHGYSTVLTIGRATFDSKRLFVQNILPDDFRSYIGTPVPAGYKRDKIHVVATEDGNAIEYAFIDRQQNLSINQSFITRVEGTHAVRCTRPSASQIGMEVIDGALNFGNVNANAVGGAQAAAAAGPVGVAGLVLRSLIDTVRIPIAAIRRLLPVTIHEITVRIWHRKGTNWRGPSIAAHLVMLNQLRRSTFLNPQASIAYALDLTELHDIPGTYCELRGLFIGSGVNAANDFGFVFWPRVNAEFPLDGADGFILSRNDLSVGQPNSNGTRGYNLGVMVAKQLQDPYQGAAAGSTIINRPAVDRNTAFG